MEKILLNFAERLGLKDDSTFRKTQEFLRIYQSKPAVKCLNDVAKSILCLDLAASNLGVGFDQKQAMKLSGLKKQLYINQLHTLEKLLHVDKILTIKTLCVQLSCTVVQETAEHILDEYKNKHFMGDDFEHPQYISAAVYTACKLKKIKIDKLQLVATSQLKSAQWKELLVRFNEIAENLGTPKIEDSGRKRDLTRKLQDITKKIDTENRGSPSKRKCVHEEKVESYQEWKDRILEESYHALKNCKSNLDQLHQPHPCHFVKEDT